MLVPSRFGVILASLGLFLALSTAASTLAFRAARLGVIGRLAVARRAPPLPPLRVACSVHYQVLDTKIFTRTQ